MKVVGQLKPMRNGESTRYIEFPAPFAKEPTASFSLVLPWPASSSEIPPLVLFTGIAGWTTRPLNGPPGEYVGDVWIGVHVMATVLGESWWVDRCAVHYEFEGEAGDPT